MRTLFTQFVANKNFLFELFFGLLTRDLYLLQFPYLMNFSKEYYTSC